jgi:hypothetical protein
MKRLLLLTLLTFAAPLARAQTGMNLAWNNCITEGNCSADKAYACDGSQNGTPLKLVFSFFPPVDLPEFVGLMATIDVRTPSEPLPDWWRLTSGECREGNLSFPGPWSGIGTGTTGACQTAWANATIGGGYQWYSNSDGDSTVAGMGRLRLALARDADYPVALSANQQYVGGVVALDTFGDIDSGSGLCSGCTQPACIVLVQIELDQMVGAPGGDVHLITTPETRQYVTWQGGLVGGCQISMPQRTLWGSIRSIYR